MRYEVSDRVQHENYHCEVCLIQDVLETLFDEDLDSGCVNIIADAFVTESIFKTLCKIKVNDFEFDVAVVDFTNKDDLVAEYCTTILDNGEVYIEPAKNKNGEYNNLDGFMFVESEINEDVYQGENRHCDVMVFSIDEC